MIKALIEAVQFRLTFWVSEQRRDSRLGIASLDLTNQIQITNHEDMKNYLLGLAKKIKNKNRYDFSYPVEQADYIEGEFVSDRINEILKYENGTNEDVIISHYYNDTVKIESSSMRAIALGEHKRHPLYTENSTKIKWPATIAKEQQEALPAISNEIELAGIILKSVQDMNEAQSLLAQTGFVTIIEFTENILRNKAKELNITEAIYFNTTVEHEVTDMGAAMTAVGGGRKVKSTIQLGEIAFGHLGDRHPGGFISSLKLDELARYAYSLDMQTIFENTINQWRSDKKLRKAFDIFSRSKFKPLIAAGIKIYRVDYYRTRLAGMLAFVNSRGEIVLISLQDNSAEIFASRAQLESLIEKRTRIWKWFRNHAVNQQSMNIIFTGGPYLPRVGPKPSCTFREVGSEFSYYDDFLSQLSVQADRLAKSNSELFWETVFGIVKVLGSIAGPLTFEFGLLPSIAMTIATQTAPEIGLALISDDLHERDKLLFEASTSVPQQIQALSGVGMQ